MFWNGRRIQCLTKSTVTLFIQLHKNWNCAKNKHNLMMHNAAMHTHAHTHTQ